VNVVRVKVREHAEKGREFAVEPPEGALVIRDALVVDEDTGRALLVHRPLSRGAVALMERLRPWLLSFRGWTDKAGPATGGGSRLGGIKNENRVFGFTEAVKLRRRFGASVSMFNLEYPNVATLLEEIAGHCWSEFEERLPERAAEHLSLVEPISEAWRMRRGTVPWTSGIINGTAAMPYHKDAGNVLESWSAMVTLKDCQGGMLHLPSLGLYLACDDLSLTVFNGQQHLHGVTPITRKRRGYRHSIVFYAKRGFIGALPPGEEVRRAQVTADATADAVGKAEPEKVAEVGMLRPKRKGLPGAPLEFFLRPGASDEKAIREVIEKNAYQRPRLGFVIEPGDRWLDGGVNVGSFTALAHRLGVETVVGYEAEARNVEASRRNLQHNGVPFEVRHAAIVSDDFEGDTIGLHVCDEVGKEWRHSTQWQRKKSTTVYVPAVRVSEALERDGLDCVKLDIEGAEIPMLRHPAFPYAKIRKLAFEWSFDVERRMAVLREVLDRVEAAFPHVSLSKGNLPWEAETYDFFPPQVMVYAWR